MSEVHTGSVSACTDDPRSSGFRLYRLAARPFVGRRALQLMTAGGIVVATIALAAPSWAGPLGGC